MKILVVGSGGREHALVWKIAQASKVEKIYCAPGNGGISKIAECIDIKAEDIQALVDFASKNEIDLSIIGPEAPLALGIVDEFQSRGLKVFGPTKVASQLESSKIFAKKIMQKYNVPTAGFEVFDDAQKAREYIKEANRPLVIKADGLCAGKGVFVCQTHEEQVHAINTILEDNVFGKAGSKIMIEEMLEGEEASIIVISDQEHVISMASSQDHKRIFDEDKGPNTGGMGAYSPAPIITDGLLKQIERDVIIPMIRGMKAQGMPFCGVLYAGMMITQTGPKVLEFNVRFGDPETQAILPRLKTDIVEIFEAAVTGKLDQITPVWDDRACVCVVLASGGYPAKYDKAKIIEGLDDAASSDVVIFHAGTKKEGDTILTNAGRVLGVTGLGADIGKAIEVTYDAVEKIKFDRIFFRRDIGKKALARIS